MKVVKTAEQRAIEDAQWLANKVGYLKGLKKPSELQTLFVKLAEIDPASRKPQQARQLAALIKGEKLDERAKEARAEGIRLGQVRELKDKAKVVEDRKKILLGAMLIDQMKKQPAAEPGIFKMLDAFLTRDGDRALFNFPPQQKSL